MILQMKKGYLDVEYFNRKFQVNIVDNWKSQWDEYVSEGMIRMPSDSDGHVQRIDLTMDGLLRVDSLLPAFFEPEFRGVRYT